jgi:homoserine dehydrogenase
MVAGRYDYGEQNLKSVKIGLCGLGTVGAGTFNLISANQAIINAHAGREILISHIGTRRDNPACDLTAVKVARDIRAVVNSDVDIVVEAIGGTEIAKDLVLAALSSGKHVVTANKALIAEHGNEIFAMARTHGVKVRFEAAVAGGIPIIKCLREGLAANKIEWLAGIINGTGNYILTEMRDKGREFSDVLGEAQKLGYAEADPTFDISGIDAAHKLAILAAIAFGMPLEFTAIYIEGIDRIQPKDLKFAEELGYRIKHLGIARVREAGVELRVHPTLVPENCLIAQVEGVMNAVMVKGDAAGSTLYYGAGAGAEPTASAVVADIIDIARGMEADVAAFLPHLGIAEKALTRFPVLAIEEVETACYLRASVLDKPGVLSTIAQIMSTHGISIEAIIQKQPAIGQDHVTLIMLTNKVLEKHLREAIADIEHLDSVNGEIVHIRVEPLDD